MDRRQDQLPGLVARRAHRIHDFLDLFPGKVMPTNEIYMLERDGNLLVMRSYDHGAKEVKPQERMWKLLVRYGEVVDAPGSITVICMWGLGTATVREWVVYEATGKSEHAGTVDEFRAVLRRWWDDAKRGR